jgi:hypothetical protein
MVAEKRAWERSRAEINAPLDSMRARGVLELEPIYDAWVYYGREKLTAAEWAFLNENYVIRPCGAGARKKGRER